MTENSTDFTAADGRDQILGALIGLTRACENNPKTENTDRVIIEALAACSIENRISGDSLTGLIAMIQEEKDAVAPGCAVCRTPCGNTAAYDMSRMEAGENGAVKRRLLKDACHTAALLVNEELSAARAQAALTLFYRILPMVSYELDVDRYLSLQNEMDAIRQ